MLKKIWKLFPYLTNWYVQLINVTDTYIFDYTPRNVGKKGFKRRPSSLSELSPIIFNMELIHLDSEASKYKPALIINDYYFSKNILIFINIISIYLMTIKWHFGNTFDRKISEIEDFWDYI